MAFVEFPVQPGRFSPTVPSLKLRLCGFSPLGSDLQRVFPVFSGHFVETLDVFEGAVQREVTA